MTVELKRILLAGVIEPEWVNPVVVSRSKGGLWLCVDLCEPNISVIMDYHPLPHMEDLFTQLGGVTHFSQIDLMTNTNIFWAILKCSQRSLNYDYAVFSPKCKRLLRKWLDIGPQHQTDCTFLSLHLNTGQTRSCCTSQTVGEVWENQAATHLFTCRGPGFDVASAMHHRVLSLSFFRRSQAIPDHWTEAHKHGCRLGWRIQMD